MFGVCEGRRSGSDPVQFDAGVKKKNKCTTRGSEWWVIYDWMLFPISSTWSLHDGHAASDTEWSEGLTQIQSIFMICENSLEGRAHPFAIFRNSGIGTDIARKATLAHCEKGRIDITLPQNEADATAYFEIFFLPKGGLFCSPCHIRIK